MLPCQEAGCRLRAEDFAAAGLIVPAAAGAAPYAAGAAQKRCCSHSKPMRECCPLWILRCKNRCTTASLQPQWQSKE